MRHCYLGLYLPFFSYRLRPPSKSVSWKSPSQIRRRTIPPSDGGPSIGNNFFFLLFSSLEASPRPHKLVIIFLWLSPQHDKSELSPSTDPPPHRKIAVSGSSPVRARSPGIEALCPSLSHGRDYPLLSNSPDEIKHCRSTLNAPLVGQGRFAGSSLSHHSRQCAPPQIEAFFSYRDFFVALSCISSLPLHFLTKD